MPTLYCNFESIPKSFLPSQTTGRVASKIYKIEPHSVLSIPRSSHPKVFLRNGVLKICSKFTGEHSCRSVISRKLLCRFQTDCLKLSFWTCRQMSGGRFLFGLREMQVSEKILLIMSLLTASINIWNEDISPDANNESMWREFEHDLELLESDIDSFLLDE